jgi:hypothetical protein
MVALQGISDLGSVIEGTKSQRMMRTFFSQGKAPKDRPLVLWKSQDFWLAHSGNLIPTSIGSAF